MAQKPYMDRLFGLFSLKSDGKTISPKTGIGNKTADVNIGSANGSYKTPLQRIWEWYLRETLDTSDTLKDRKLRYKELEFMVQNDPVVQMAADLYADEAVQADNNSGTPVRVKAKSEVQSFIEDLLLQWGYTQPVCRELIYNKNVYGDSFDANQVTEKEGIVSVTPISVYDVKDRLEFDPSQTLIHMNSLMGTTGDTKMQKLSRLKSDLEDAKTDPTAVFRKYLFGFELASGLVVPPWGISHYRSFSLQPEFAPWGRSRFINTLTTFRQLLAAKGLMQVARAVSFPRDLYEVQTEPGMTAPEKWDACEEFQEQLDNAGLTGGDRETPTIGNRLILPKDSVTHTQLETNVDPSAIADVEFLRDDEIISTFIPKGYLITDKASFGTSGQSLLQQFKPFGRRVFSDQSDFLRELTFKVKTHLAILNKFNGFDTVFELSMVFPVVEESADRLQRKSEELDLAQKSITIIKDTLGLDKIPADVIKDAFLDMSFLSPEQINSWVDQMVKANPETAEGEGESPQNYFEKARNRYYEGKTREELKEKLLLEKAACRFHEGKCGNRHYYSSAQLSLGEARNRKIIESFLERGDKTLFNETYKRSGNSLVRVK